MLNVDYFCCFIRKVFLCLLVFGAGLSYAGTYVIEWNQNFTPIVDSDGNLTLQWPDSGHGWYLVYDSYRGYQTYTDQLSMSFTGLPNGNHYFYISACFIHDDYCDMGTSVMLTVTNSSATPRTANLVVRRHSTAQLTAAEADSIFLSATQVLSQSDSTTDFRCPVALARAGNVGVFTAGDGSIDNQNEFNALQSGINVVNNISWCGSLTPNVIGCASLPGNRIAVVRTSTAWEGILWAHEYGHNKGISHSTATNAVMRGAISSQNRNVNMHECNDFKKNL